MTHGKFIPDHEKRILEAFVRKIAFRELAFVETPLDEYQAAQLDELIALRASGIPVQYLVGSQEFYGREFYVNSCVLIPRPETEGLVEKVLQELNYDHENKICLDFGTGSGCIAITLKCEASALKIYASDASEEALHVAQENAKRLNARIFWQKTAPIPNLKDYAELPELDFIVSNPPYLMVEDEIADDVRRYEPPEALFAHDTDALFFYGFLAQLADIKLKRQGFGLFEVSELRAQMVKQLFERHGYQTHIKLDLTERERYVLIRKYG